MEGGGCRAFMEVMKYFRHILMVHERCSKIFDGPQNIFLCSLLSFKLRGQERKTSKPVIKEI